MIAFLSLLFSFYLCISFFHFSPRGIPGKKCGTIILSAEELSNCRVCIISTHCNKRAAHQCYTTHGRCWLKGYVHRCNHFLLLCSIFNKKRSNFAISLDFLTFCAYSCYACLGVSWVTDNKQTPCSLILHSGSLPFVPYFFLMYSWYISRKYGGQ